MDPIDREAAIDGLWNLDVELRPSAIDAILNMLKGLPSLHHLCNGCKHKDDQNKIEYVKVSPCIFCLRSAHDNYEREDADENSSQKDGT